MNNIEKRIETICKSMGVPNDADVIKAYAQAYNSGFKNIIVAKVSDDYYDLDLKERVVQIGSFCKSTSQLTKCLLYENRQAPLESRNVIFSRYYLIIYQYSRKFSEPKFHTWLRSLRGTDPAFAHLTKQMYNYGFVDEKVAKQLCSADHNGMSPIGLIDVEIPVVVDTCIQEEHIFVGGLHPFVKVRIQMQELLKNFKSHQVLVTDPVQ